MQRGYIKLFRKIQENDQWLSEPFTRSQAWIDLILLANYKPGVIRVRGNRVEVKRGQVGWSQVALANRWKWSRGKVRRFLKELEKNEQQIVQQKSSITSLITIIKYDEYQGNGTADGTTDGQQTDSRRYTNNNSKKDKKGKKTNKGVNTPSSKESSFDVPESYKNCPQKEIIEAYHQHLPQLPTIQIWDDQSAKRLRQRWRQDPKCQCIEFWVEYFKWVAQSRFLMGQVNDFQADLHWLVRPTNFAKVINGRYHNKKTFHERIREVGGSWLQETNDS
jgi:hypothetical protein